MQKENVNVVVTKECHSRMSLSGISHVLSCCHYKQCVILNSFQDLHRLFSTRGFTLIELLVVVLIIGILAAVAVPQYQKAVEKSRLSEALMNLKTIQNSIDVSLLENGFPGDNSPTHLEDFDDAGALQGGFLQGTSDYYTKNFNYFAACGNSCSIEIYREERDEEMEPTAIHYILYSVKSDDEMFGVQFSTDKWTNLCLTKYTDMGDYICKSLESQGFVYVEGEI